MIGAAPLEIGLVCPYSFASPGGVQNQVLGLARYLRSAGHRPQVLAPGELPVGATADDRAGFTTAGPAVPVSYNGSVARVCFGPQSAARVRSWLRQGRFDLVHLHEPITPSISLLTLWSAQVPVVATFHTATPRSRTMLLAGRALRDTIAKIDARIAVSEAARDVVVQHLGRDAQVIPNGFRFDDFAAPTRSLNSHRLGSTPRLVFLGRVDEPRKGLDVLLAADPLIRRRHPGLQVVVAGAGRRALPSWWETAGVVDDPTKARLLAGADVFVAPHLERESFGIVLLEALASGTPVVASDLAPFVDLLDPAERRGDPKLAEMFRAGDPVALAEAVDRVLADRDGSRLRRAIDWSRRYDWSVVGPEIEAVYGAALAGIPLEPRGFEPSHPRELVWPRER